MAELKPKIERIIEKHVSNEYIIGFSLLEELVPRNFKRLKYGITIGIKLDDKIMAGIKNGPTADYEQHYHDINTALNKIARDVRRMLKRQGNKAEIIRATIEPREEKKYPKYEKTLSVEFSHKIAATRSGLGWIGKSALFVSPKFGPQLRLVTILTDKELDTGQPVKSSICGHCDICVQKCPAQAIIGKNWSVGMEREDIYDAHKCRSTAKELAQNRIGKDEVICGICIAVCPIGKKMDIE
ncbi:MAG: epoxyqueuosine reductase [Thermoplasmata archaeon]|nr:MAG: epoxyqueuosine reductase [Thermoplasmata archaeon]